MILFGVLAILVLCFGLVVSIGAPYLPTLKPQAEAAFELLDLKKGQTLYELGSGDGVMLILAAKRGIKAIGYEINPILFGISWLRTRRYRSLVQVRFDNFWRADISDADGIFVFLHTRFMQKLHKKVIESKQDKVIKVVSFAFKIPGKTVDQSRGAVYLYTY